uniref:CSON010903 protein n=1 Tax=Culicoides sonorensis TaxID=179676 RepID=A0A336KT89_CULSO
MRHFGVSPFVLIFLCISVTYASLSHIQRIECDEVKSDDSYDGSTCTITKINADEGTEFDFIRNDIRIWWFIKKDLNFGWFKNIIIKDSTVKTIPRPFMTQYAKMEVLSMDNCGVVDWHPLTFTHAKNLRQLLLSRNQVSEIPRLAFFNANVLEVIDLQNNRISKIDKYAFINLETLKELKLAYNKLNVIDIQIFTNINLRYFDVSHNTLENLSIELESVFKQKNMKKHEFKFLANDNQLKQIYIQDDFPVTELHLQNNQLTFMSTIISLNHLKYLNLQTNPMKNLPLTTFFNLVNLQYLNVRDTQMDEMHGALFSRLTKLKHLDLSSNNFTKIDIGMLAAMSELEELVLFNNMLMTADAKSLTLIFPHLKNVWISSNAWDCDDFAEFSNALKETGIKINTGEGKYGTKYKGGALCVPTVFL